MIRRFTAALKSPAGDLLTLTFNLLVLSFFFFFPAFISAQEDDPRDDVIRVGTDLVTIPAVVLDTNGKSVSTLKKEDFQVFEDDVEQKIELFEATEQPFSILFLMDNSSSMTPYLQALADTANAFARQLRADDQMVAAVYSDVGQVNVLLAPTRKKDLQGKITLKARRGDGKTTTYDAVEYGLKYMKKFSGRKAIVLFTDTEVDGLLASAKSNLRDAERQEAVVYTIRFGSFRPVSENHPYRKMIFKQYEEIEKYLKSLPEKTGGRSFQVQNVAELEKAFQEVVADLRRQYMLGYYPNEIGDLEKSRRIKVKVSLPSAIVRARSEVSYKPAKKKGQ